VAGAGGLGDGAAVRQRHGRGYREGQASPGQQPVLSPDLSRGQVLADPQEPAAIPGDHLKSAVVRRPSADPAPARRWCTDACLEPGRIAFGQSNSRRRRLGRARFASKFGLLRGPRQPMRSWTAHEGKHSD
jgi:hypothetical protein